MTPLLLSAEFDLASRALAWALWTLLEDRDVVPMRLFVH